MSIEQIIGEIGKPTPIGPSTNARPKGNKAREFPWLHLLAGNNFPQLSSFHLHLHI